MMINHKDNIKVPNIQNKICSKTLRTNFSYWKTEKNPDFEDGLRACLINNNAEILQKQNISDTPTNIIKIKTNPKWFTYFFYDEADKLTGEIISENNIYASNDLTAGNWRKIKALNKFCEFYQPLYEARDISLLFHTLTRVNYSKTTIRRLLDDIKYRYTSYSHPLLGYLWTMEVSDNMHIHYHLVTAADRIKIKGGKIPQVLKLDDVWGQSTQVEFVKKNVRNYLSQYFAKNNFRVEGQRMYGQSRIFRTV